MALLKRRRGIWLTASERAGNRARQRGEVESFGGPVEADETYIGGKEGNKREDKKLNAGRGAVGKAPGAGVKDRATNKIDAQAVIATDAATLKGFVHRRTAPDAIVYTDDSRAYTGLRRAHIAGQA